MKFYVNARYLIVPFMSLIAIAGILIGGSFAWVGVALFGLNTIIAVSYTHLTLPTNREV